MTRTLTIIALLFGVIAAAVAASVGSGAATTAIQASFQNAYYRGQFSLLVNTPTTDVKGLGTPGLVQEFPSKANATAKYALVKPDPNAPVSQLDTLQMFPDLYTFFLSVGVATTGYPTVDTTPCPTNPAGVCNYQFFANNYALFSYSTPVTSNLAVRDPFYTVWQNTGGIGGPLGVVTNAETAVTSVTKVAATRQAFSGGHIYSYPAGSATPSTYTVSGAFYTAWTTNGDLTFPGLPTSEALPVSAQANATIRQTFEAGRIEQTPGSDPVVLFPVSLVGITFSSQGLSLLPGATATINATTLDTRGNTVTGRTMTWSSTNGAVVQVIGNGYSATVQAIATGTANVFVTVEGKTSPPISVRVGGACCLVGEGAPSSVISQAFQAALDRNQLTATLPVAATVARAGNGYIQSVTAAGTAYVISIADGAGTAYLSSGAIYAAYLAIGGFSGPLGYPASDLLPGGAQRYLSGAVLSGSPVRVVPSLIAAKWYLNGGPLGTLGQPTSDVAAFQSIPGTAGTSQNFTSGAVFQVGAGSTYVSSGLILARYVALGGATGSLGAPVSDLSNNRQDFETGYIDLQPGAAAAVEHFNARKPAIAVSPATVVPGGRVHVSTTGFTPGATLNFTVTGQANFSVKAAAGTYAWDIFVPTSAKAGSVSVQATVPGSADAATATYTISPASALLPKLTIVSGDQQTGAPGSTLAAPLVVSLVDSSGTPVAGVPVGWTLSPGATVSGAATTDSNGRAQGLIRLQASSGILVGSVSAAGQVVTFSALISPRAITGFPAFQQIVPGGAFLASLASLLRYQQDRGVLSTLRGALTPAALDAYLASNKGYGISDNGRSTPNPWVAAGYGGGGISLESPSLNTIQDLVGAGTPVAVVLGIRINGVAAGSTVVDAIGIRADGSVAIADPDPGYAATSLGDYLNGFAVAGRQVVGTLGAVIRVTGTQPGGNALTVATTFAATATMGSLSGACQALDIGDSGSAGGVRYHYCDPNLASPDYELDLAAQKGASIVNLTDGSLVTVPADTNSAWKVTRVAGVVTVVPQALAIASVNDAAGFGTAIGPGAIVSVFGTGFAAGGRTPVVTLNGRSLQVLFATTFQINAVIPPDVAAGSASLQVTGALGTAAQAIQLVAAGPGIFVIGVSDQKPLGAVINQDGTVNGPLNPATRGQFISIYGTGLGATVLRNGLQATVAPVTVSINGGASMAASFSGAVAGFVGLYQVNVQIPESTPPSLSTAITLNEGGRASNVVVVALQ